MIKQTPKQLEKLRLQAARLQKKAEKAREKYIIAWGGRVVALLLLLSLLFVVPAKATFTTAQHRSNIGCGGVSSCGVTGFSAIGTGSLIIGIGYSISGGIGVTGASGGGTWVLPTGCAGTSDCSATDASAGAVFFQYVLSSTGAPTTINVLSSSLSIEAAEVMVFTFTSGPVSFDVGGSADRSTNCTSCAGIGLTPTGNDVIVQGATCQQSCATSATAGFIGAAPYVTTSGGVNDFPTGDAAGAAINQSTGTAPNISQSPTGRMSVGAVAFKESSGSTVTRGKAIIF